MATPPPQRRNNLRELLKQEQEPFHVQSSCNRQNPRQNASFPSAFSRNACFCSSSPDPFNKSPLSLSPAPNNNNNNNNKSSDALFLHVPPKTAALLFQAALRVHKSKTRIPNSGFGLIGSLIKKLTRIRTRIPKTGDDDDVVKWEASAKTTGLWSSSSCSSSSSSFCSTTTSGTGSNSSRGEGNGEGVTFLKCLEIHSMLQENLNYEQSPPVKSAGQEDEEDRQQNSPVSILDRPFEDDESCQDREEESEFQGKDGKFNLECSYAFLQRSKSCLLLNLQSFEGLAELEPTKLEHEIVVEEDFLSTTNKFELDIDDSLVDVSCESSLIKDLESPWMKRLIYDMINEEERLNCRSSSGDHLNNSQLIVKRVCKPLESWQEVKAHTIDMMIDIDFREEGDKWKKQQDDDEIARVATKVELSIYSGLMKELLDELMSALD